MRLRALIFLVAVACFSPLAAASPEADKVDEQARAYFRAQSYERAAQEFRKAYELDKKPARLFNVGLAYEKAGNKKLASEAYGEFVSVAAEDPKAVEARARKDALDRQIAEEDKAKQETLEQAKARAAAEALASLAAEKVESGDHEEAAALYLKAFDTDGTKKYLFDRAEALRKGGKDDAAIEAYRKYRAEDPGGLYEADAKTRQEELLAAKARANAQATGLGLESGPASKEPAPPSGRGLRIAAYAAGGVALVGAGFALYGRSEFNRVQGELDEGKPSILVDDPGHYDILFGISLSTSMQGIGAATFCYLMGKDDSWDSSATSLGACVLGGAGVATLAFAGIAALTAKGESDYLAEEGWNDSGMWEEKYERSIDRGSTWNKVAIGSAIGGAAGIALGGLLYWIDDSNETAQKLTVLPNLGSEPGFTAGFTF